MIFQTLPCVSPVLDDRGFLSAPAVVELTEQTLCEVPQVIILSRSAGAVQKRFVRMAKQASFFDADFDCVQLVLLRDLPVDCPTNTVGQIDRPTNSVGFDIDENQSGFRCNTRTNSRGREF